MTPDFVATLSTALAGTYAIGDQFASGGMGILFRADDLKHHRTVALKILRPDLSETIAAQRFLREIQIASRLHHPHIVPLFDSGEVDGILYFVMPLIDGESLRTRIQREMQLPLEQAVSITKEVADALGYAHSRGVIHRDIKPGNILLESGHAVVTDFGISRAVWTAADGPVTADGLPLGTAEYMSPEQANGHVDSRSDIYSLGCVLYEMLAGEPPFTGRTVLSVLARHASERVPSIRTVRPTVPEALDCIAARALAKVPGDRFPDAAALIDALSAAEPHGDRSAPNLMLAVASDRSPNRDEDGQWRAIAVLPFANVGGDAEQEYFADGMTDEIITALTHVPRLRVSPRTSVDALRKHGFDIHDIGHRLNVDSVLEGDVRWAGDAFKIDARLTDPMTGYNLWAGSFARRMSEVFAVQEELSRTIVAELRIALQGANAAPLVKRYTDDVDAYRSYLRGRYFWNQRTPQSLQRAVQCFQETLQRDAAYALAHSGLADAYLALAQFQYVSPHDVLPKAEATAMRAIELDDSLAEAHTSLAHVNEVYHWRWCDAGVEYLRALERDPNYATAHAWYADYLMCTGRDEEAFRRMQSAQRLEPLSIPIEFQATTLLYRARRFKEAVERYRRIIEMEPRYWPAYLFLGFAASRLGEFDKAESVLERAGEILGPAPGVRASLGYVYALAGKRDKAVNCLHALLACADHGYLSPSFPAILYAALGDHDQAFAWLDRAYQDHSLLIGVVKIEPALDNLRSDPRFAALVKSVFP